MSPVLPIASSAIPVTPMPTWADQEPWSPPTSDPSDRTAFGRVVWLEDTQANVTEPEHHWLWRRVQEVATADGLQAASTFDISFEPTFEQPEAHHVRVIRDGVARDALAPEAFQMLRRERDLERGVYNGELTAHLVIPDVRVGDIVETAYSIRRRHPVLRESFGVFVILQYAAPVHDVRFRLLTRKERPLSFRTWGDPPQPSETLRGDLLDRRWRAVDAPPLQDEPDIPQWWRSWAAVRIGDQLSWSEVADVFRPLYLEADPPPADLQAAAREIEAAQPDPAGRIAEALRWVQRTTRYIASGIGEGGLTPRSLTEIVASRSGDCKDASRLLVALLGCLGVRADPALVDTAADPDLPLHPAYLLAFNHCVVRVVLEGRTYWLDPTRSPQGGRLNRLDQARFAWALPLVEGAELQSMGEDALETLVETHEDWSFGPRPFSPVRLEVRTISRGWKADEQRTWLANDGLSALTQRWREYYEREYGELRTLDPVRLEDDFAANEMTSVETYEIARPWTPSPDGKSVIWSHADDIVGPHLRTPESPRRRDPISLGAPRRFQTIRTVHLPKDIAVTPWDDRMEGPGVTGRTVLTRLGREKLDPPRLRLDLQIAFHERMVPAAAAGEYFAFARRMREQNGLTLSLPVRGDRFGPRHSLWLRGVAITVAVYLLLQLVFRLATSLPATAG